MSWAPALIWTLAAFIIIAALYLIRDHKRKPFVSYRELNQYRKTPDFRIRNDVK